MAGAHGPFTFELIAGGHSNLTYRVVGRGRPPARAAPAAARPSPRLRPRHGPRAPHHRRARGHAGARGPGPRLLRRRRRSTARRSTSWTSSTVTSSATAPRPRPSCRARAPASAGEPPGRHPRRHPCRRHRRGRARPTSAATRATSPASSSAGTASGSSRRPGQLPAVDEVHDLPRGAHPRAGTGVHRPRRLPARQHAWSTTTAHVVAVLDWEICTLGDPLADVGLLMVYWTGPGDEAVRVDRLGHDGAGFPRPRRARSPATPTSRVATSASIDFYVAFAFWKLACILEGVYARYLAGALGGGRDPSEHDAFRQQVEQAAGAGRRSTRRGYDRALRAPRGARARVAGARRHAHRLDRRRRRGADGHDGARRGVGRARPIATFDADTLHRLPRPASDHGAARRASTRTWSGRPSSSRPRRTATATTSSS